MSTKAVTEALISFHERALAITGDAYFEIGYDRSWRSICELEPGEDNDVCKWLPVAQPDPIDFSGLANALEAPIHQDIIAYYSAFWSGNFEAKSFEGPVSLIQLWNEDDFERLIGNLIGHLLMKQRSKQPFTVFFANTDSDSEMFLSIHNESGKVLLEEPGRPPLKEVETDVATFINRLTPLATTPVIY